MKNILYIFLICCFSFTIYSCAKKSGGSSGSSSPDANENGGGSSDSSSCNNKGSFQIHPEKGVSLWKIVKNYKDCGYALVGGKNRKPWIQVIGENGNQLISKTYDADFKAYTSNFGNGLPTEG